jgi:hypothetical protein
MRAIRTLLLKKRPFMGSIRTLMLQEKTFYRVNSDMSVTRLHVIWGQ